ncbi:hypothetical protein MUP59_00950 [Candidatus Bathyarchaeota archaeon]|nr:hypothetical protein [Candidatus Bathyarchaeota archaeon]
MKEKTYVITCKACKTESHIPAENEEHARFIWGQLHSEATNCPQTKEFIDGKGKELMEMRFVKHSSKEEILKFVQDMEKELIEKFLIIKVGKRSI